MRKNKFNNTDSFNSNKSPMNLEESLENWIENHQLLTWIIGGILVLFWGIAILVSFICCLVYGIQFVIMLCGSSTSAPIFKFIFSIIVFGGCLGIAGWVSDK